MTTTARKPYDVLVNKDVIKTLAQKAEDAIKNALEQPPDDYKVFRADRPIFAFEKSDTFKFIPPKEPEWTKFRQSTITRYEKKIQQHYTVYIVAEGRSNQFLLLPKVNG